MSTLGLLLRLGGVAAWFVLMFLLFLLGGAPVEEMRGCP
jgi:hypothetical protein